MPSRALAEWLGNDAAPTNDSTNDAGSNPSSDHAGSDASTNDAGSNPSSDHAGSLHYEPHWFPTV